MTTIEKINLQLAKHSMSGADLERKIGVSRSVYSQWNTGRTKPSMKRLKQIAELFDIQVEDLLPDNEKTAVASDARAVTDDDIKFAFFGTTDITDELYAEVKRYAQYAMEQEKFKRFNQGKE